MTLSTNDKLLVIGYGSRLHGDDAAGPLVVERLEGQVTHPRLACLSSLQLLPEMAEAISAARRVLFIDAALDEPAGAIRCRRVQPLADSALFDLGHAVNPAGLLGLARTAYGRAASARLYTIAAERLDIEASPSASVSGAVDRLAAHLIRRIPVWLERKSRR